MIYEYIWRERSVLEVYLSKEYITGKYIDDNDRWFNACYNTGKIKFDVPTIKLIQEIDGVKCIEKGYIEAKYEPEVMLEATKLSTGCKTAINIMQFPDITFSMEESGENVMEKVMCWNKGKIYISYFVNPIYEPNPVDVITEKGEHKIANTRFDLGNLMSRAFRRNKN